MLAVFIAAFVIFAACIPRITTRLDPVTGDEPFYLMTAYSLLHDHDIDETNNFANHDWLRFYPSYPLAARLAGLAGHLAGSAAPRLADLPHRPLLQAWPRHPRPDRRAVRAPGPDGRRAALQPDGGGRGGEYLSAGAHRRCPPSRSDPHRDPDGERAARDVRLLDLPGDARRAHAHLCRPALTGGAQRAVAMGARRPLHGLSALVARAVRARRGRARADLRVAAPADELAVGALCHRPGGYPARTLRGVFARLLSLSRPEPARPCGIQYHRRAVSTASSARCSTRNGDC